MNSRKLILTELVKEPLPPLSEAEVKRRELEAQRCKERCCNVPYYQQQAARMGERFWYLLSKNFINRG